MNILQELNCAITVSDRDGNVIYMNDKSIDTFHGSKVGQNLKDCHKFSSWEKILKMLDTGSSNCYTISKNGQKKMIYQTPWRENGEIAGMVEISMVIPEEMPHYIR